VTIELCQSRGALWIAISCDTCGVWERFEHPISEAMIAMKAKGWRRDLAKHKCPDCAGTKPKVTRELLLEGLDG
jgi:hypothetical protein